MKCSCGITNSFTEAITRFKLISVLVDTDIKEDILSMSDMNLEETVKAVGGKESGKEGDAMSVGTLAGIMMIMADLNMAVARYSRYKVPHMLYDQMK